MLLSLSGILAEAISFFIKVKHNLFSKWLLAGANKKYALKNNCSVLKHSPIKEFIFSKVAGSSQRLC